MSLRQFRLPGSTAAALIAALWLPATASTARAADADALRQKTQSCAACHGVDGNSPNPALPRIAGQPKQFLVTQLFMFREDKRKDPQMSPMAANLSNADLNDLADFYSAQKMAPATAKVDAEKLAAGKRLTEQNNCVACHGPALLGQQHIPRLAGQHADYLRAQLQGFKANTRFDMDGTMTSAAQALSPADIELLAAYLSGLSAP